MSVSDCVPAGTGYTMVVRVVEHIAMAESCRGGERLRMAEILVGDATGTIIVQAKNGAFPALMLCSSFRDTCREGGGLELPEGFEFAMAAVHDAHSALI